MSVSRIRSSSTDGLDVVMDDDVTTAVTKYQNGLGIDDKLSLKNGGVSRYFLADHLGSTNGLTDPSGAITSQTAYDSFGNQTGSLTTRYGYTGRERDDFSGLMYYRARFYDTNLGRFISEDPIGFGGGDVNLYGYVWNNPLHYLDPMGLDGWGNDWADYLDERIEYVRQFYQDDVQNWGWNGSVDTVADLASGTSDMLRVGSGVGHAIYAPDENGYGTAAFVAMDAARASGIFALIAGGLQPRSPIPRTSSCGRGLGGNPFKGKTAPQIDSMLRNKGYVPKGPNPMAGEGTYVNPRTGRGYHIDANPPPPKPPHVGMQRPRGKRKLPAREFPL